MVHDLREARGVSDMVAFSSCHEAVGGVQLVGSVQLVGGVLPLFQSSLAGKTLCNWGHHEFVTA